MFLFAIDAHSKWPEVYPMSSTTTGKTLDILGHIFAAHGLPEQIVTDNVPQFTLDDFAKFAKLNGIKHIRTAPYHPTSNGLAERFVQSFNPSSVPGDYSCPGIYSRSASGDYSSPSEEVTVYFH